MKVLIIEDDAALYGPLVNRFEAEEYQVEVATDGQEGLDMALAGHPDLIVLDINLPKKNGFEVLEELKQDEWGKGAKILILTNNDDIDTVAKVMEQQVFQYLVKADNSLKTILAQARAMLLD